MMELENHEQCSALNSVMTGTSLAKHGVFRVLEAGSRLWGPEDWPDSIYLLHSGKIQLVIWNTKGEELILRTVRPGELFGEVCFCSHRHEEHGSHARVELRSEIQELNYADFRRNMKQDAKLMESVLGEFCQRVQESNERVQILATYDASERLKRTLVYLAKKHGSTTLRVSHAELAAFAALSRPHVSLLMTKFRQKGWIHYKRGMPIQVKLKLL